MTKQDDPKVKEQIVVEPWRVFSIHHAQKSSYTVEQVTRLLVNNDVPDDATLDVGMNRWNVTSEIYELSISWKRPANGA